MEKSIKRVDTTINRVYNYPGITNKGGSTLKTTMNARGVGYTTYTGTNIHVPECRCGGCVLRKGKLARRGFTQEEANILKLKILNVCREEERGLGRQLTSEEILSIANSLMTDYADGVLNHGW